MNTPNFKDPVFLTEHIVSILDFYEANVDDPNGGFYQNFSDDGSVFDHQTRHLVSSTRFVFNYARAWLAFNEPRYLARVKSGIEFIREHHFNPQTKGYHWVLSVAGDKVEVVDSTNHCYGFAFVMLAYSWALKAGVTEASAYLYETWQTMESQFWDSTYELYMDEANSDFSTVDTYRGQNANMHTCEALIAAYEATQYQQFLSRALRIADHMTNRQANLCNGLIWEHYQQDWQPDWEFNKHDPKNLFRPWGFQPGHHTEWAKLLLMLSKHVEEQHTNETHSNETWLVERARALFDDVIDLSWDKEFGGICYGFAPDKSICDSEKYFWVQAESFACAARLALATQNPTYWQWYDKIWHYAWQHFVDHQYGAWFRILSRDNQKLETTKSPVGKTDYHTLGACFDVLDSLGVASQ